MKEFFQEIWWLFTMPSEEYKKMKMRHIINSICGRPKDYVEFRPYVIKGGKMKNE